MRFPFNRKVLLASAIAAASQAGVVNAAGFTVNENSASSMGTAFAGRASNAEDASIAASNPAGIAELDRAQVTLGSAVIMEGGNFEGEFTGAGGQSIAKTQSEDFLKTTPVPFGHYVQPINDKLTFGLSGYAPFGLNLDYGDEFAGKYFGDKTKIEVINLQSSFAYELRDDLSIGFGAIVSKASGELTQSSHVPLSPSEGTAEVKGDDTALTWNVGLIWQATDATTLGMSYHAATDYKMEGTNTVNMSGIIGGVVNGEHDAKLDITMPERVMFSGTHQINDRWSVMADATWTRWSQLDSVSVESSQGDETSSYVPMNWNNVWALSLGTSYKVSNDWTLKAGYMFDQSPTTDENRTVRAPDGDRNWFTAGAKWDATEDLTFDFSAAYVMLKDGKIDEEKHNVVDGEDGGVDPSYGELTGEYTDQSTWILSAQMTYRF